MATGDDQRSRWRLFITSLGWLVAGSTPVCAQTALPQLPQITYQFFSPSDYQANETAMNQTLGVAGDAIDNFSSSPLSSTLLPGLSITLSGGGVNPNPTTLTSLENYFTGACSQQWSWSPGGYAVVNNIANTISSCNGTNYGSNMITFNLPSGTTQFGIGLANFQSLSIGTHDLWVNNVDVGHIETLAGTNWVPETVRNAYLVLTATSGSISSVGFQTDNNLIDDIGFSDLAIGQGGGSATDGPLPLWALGALGAGVVGIASRRFKRAA